MRFESKNVFSWRLKTDGWIVWQRPIGYRKFSAFSKDAGLEALTNQLCYVMSVYVSAAIATCGVR